MKTKPFKFTLRLVAALTLSYYLWQDFLFAAQSVPTPLSAPISSASSDLLGQFHFPEKLGFAKAVKSGSGAEVIINIEDAHANLGAQKSIAALLDTFIKNYDLGLVGLEGSSGELDTSIISSFPEKDIREKVANSLLNDTKISAGEFYKIVSGSEVELFGVEQSALYEKNLVAFKKLLEHRSQSEQELGHLEELLTVLGKRIYPMDATQLKESASLYQKGEKEFGVYWQLLKDAAIKMDVHYSIYPNAALLVRATDIEKTIDFHKAEQQRDRLLETFRNILPKDSLEKVVTKALEFKTGKISPGAFHSFLAELAEEKGLKWDEYPDLHRYTQYVSLYESIDILKVQEEIEKLTEDVLKRLFTNETQQKFYSLEKTAAVLKAMLLASATEKDYKFFLNHREDFSEESLKNSLEALCVQYGFVLDELLIQSLANRLPDAAEFYRQADERNKALYENLIKRMRQKHVRVAALVTGGFHTEGLSELMSQNRVSHIVIMPKFDSKEGERPYFAVITRKGSELENEMKKRNANTNGRHDAFVVGQERHEV